MKVFMKEMIFDLTLSDEDWENIDTSIGELQWKQAYENDWDEENLYIDDKFHHAGYWGSCYDKSDLRYLIERRMKQEINMGKK